MRFQKRACRGLSLVKLLHELYVSFFLCFNLNLFSPSEAPSSYQLQGRFQDPLYAVINHSLSNIKNHTDLVAITFDKPARPTEVEYREIGWEFESSNKASGLIKLIDGGFICRLTTATSKISEV